MEIVRKVRDLIFEVKVNPGDSHLVDPGLAAKVQLSALKQRTTQMVDGTLACVSGDAIAPQGGQDPRCYLDEVKGDPGPTKLTNDQVLAQGCRLAFVCGRLRVRSLNTSWHRG